jgi:opacity protein-like surface antigen
MRIRDLAGLAALLVLPATAAVAQKTGDEARIIFTVSGAYIAGKGLWAVNDQPVQDPPFADTFMISRNIAPTFGVGFSGAYFPGATIGLTGDLLLLGLGYDDSCRIAGTPQSPQNVEVCEDIEERDKSAAAVTLSAGANFRFFSREAISPFLRANVGLLFSNQSSVLTQGVTNSGLLFTIYEDEKRSRVTPGLSFGAGATMAISRGYHLRWEVRDNIVGIETVTGPTAAAGQVPPHERVYKHMFSVLIGVDVILERSRGRRY